MLQSMSWLVLHIGTGKILKAGTPTSLIFGFDEVQLIGMSFEELMPESEREQKVQERTNFATMPTNQIDATQSKFRRANGTEFAARIGRFGTCEMFAAGFAVVVIYTPPPTVVIVGSGSLSGANLQGSKLP